MQAKLEVDLLNNGLQQRTISFTTPQGYIKKRIGLVLNSINHNMTSGSAECLSLLREVNKAISTYDFSKVNGSNKYIKICTKCNRVLSIRVYAKSSWDF